MGFVGKALPSAHLLLRAGIDTGRQALISKAIALVDVWVTNAMTASGVPKTWFNTCAASQDPAGTYNSAPLLRHSAPFAVSLRLRSTNYFVIGKGLMVDVATRMRRSSGRCSGVETPRTWGT